MRLLFYLLIFKIFLAIIIKIHRSMVKKMNNNDDNIYLKQLYAYLKYLIKNAKNDLDNLYKIELIINTQLELLKDGNKLNTDLNKLLTKNSLNENNILSFDKNNENINFKIDDSFLCGFNCYLSIPIINNDDLALNKIKSINALVLEESINISNLNDLNDYSIQDIQNIKEELKTDLNDLDINELFNIFAFCKLNPIPYNVLEKIVQQQDLINKNNGLKAKWNNDTNYNVSYAILKKIITNLPNYKDTILNLKKHSNNLPHLINNFENKFYEDELKSYLAYLKKVIEVQSTQLDALNKFLAFYMQYLNEINLNNDSLKIKLYCNNLDLANNYKVFYAQWKDFLENKNNLKHDEYGINLLLSVSLKNKDKDPVIITLLNHTSTKWKLNDFKKQKTNLFNKKNLDFFNNFNMKDFLDDVNYALTNIDSNLLKNNYTYKEFETFIKEYKTKLENETKSIRR